MLGHCLAKVAKTQDSVANIKQTMAAVKWYYIIHSKILTTDDEREGGEGRREYA